MAGWKTWRNDTRFGIDRPARQGCLDITAHAHVFGRPAGAIAFAAALAEVKRHEEFAFLTSHRALAAMWRRP